MIQSPVSLYGSKSTIAPWLISHFPAHSVYLEPFCGSIRVLLAKPPSPAELVSDLDPFLINFWQQIRDHWHLLKYRCLYDFDRAFFSFARKNLWPEDRLEAARRFYAITRCSYKHIQHSSSFDPLQRGSFYSGLAKFEAASRRLMNVRIDRCCYQTPLLLNNVQDAFAYLDPPYHPETLHHWNGYRIGFGVTQHDELLKFVRSLNLKIMLSGYDHPSYRRALKDWNARRKRTRISLGNQKSDPSRWEWIWMNY